MDWSKENKDTLNTILEKFFQFIQIQIQKFDPQKNGLDPDDLAQEIRIKIWHILEDEKKIRNYSSYIKKVVNSTVIDQLRKAKRDDRIISHAKQKWIAEQETYYAKNNPYGKNHKQIVGKAVESLLKSRQRVVRLFLLNLSIEEIAGTLNWSKDKTRNLLYRGLADLKKKLKEESLDYED